MKLFFDSEFTGLHKDTTLISIGIISEDYRTFYAEFNDYDMNQVDGWIMENVIQNLRMKPPKDDEQEHYIKSRVSDNVPLTKAFSLEMRGNKEEITKGLKEWLDQFNEVEIWSDCLAYDWVLFCDLFDGALNLPENIYYIPFDICTMFKMTGVDPDINRERFAEVEHIRAKKHNALSDAAVIKICYDKLKNMY